MTKEKDKQLYSNFIGIMRRKENDGKHYKEVTTKDLMEVLKCSSFDVWNCVEQARKDGLPIKEEKPNTYRLNAFTNEEIRIKQLLGKASAKNLSRKTEIR